VILRTGVCAGTRLKCCYRPAKKLQLLTHSLTHAGHVAVAELQPLPRPGRCAGVKEHSVAGAAGCCLPFGGPGRPADLTQLPNHHQSSQLYRPHSFVQVINRVSYLLSICVYCMWVWG